MKFVAKSAGRMSLFLLLFANSCGLTQQTGLGWLLWNCVSLLYPTLGSDHDKPVHRLCNAAETQPQSPLSLPRSGTWPPRRRSPRLRGTAIMCGPGAPTQRTPTWLPPVCATALALTTGPVSTSMEGSLLLCLFACRGLRQDRPYLGPAGRDRGGCAAAPPPRACGNVSVAPLWEFPGVVRWYAVSRFFLLCLFMLLPYF